ncbi:MAG: hypothetical protein J6A87_05025, partial [Clostridia bacterium]|nr:hypothetical protein [Clostridia bacterium]
MAFCSFPKEFTTHSFTYVENRFIQKYLPEANDFAVKVYLYGLHLCQCGNDDFSARSLAEVLKTTEEKILDAFEYWQDYDLVEILCRNPLTVQYLPVASQNGRPKKIHYDKYADFTQELQKKMQKVGRFLSLQEIRKYLQFLEETDLQPMAFLLIIEYSLIKDGGRYIPYHVFEKAKQLVQKNLTTYDQIAKLLGDYDGNEKEINELFEVLYITRLLHKDDYALYNS